MPHWTETVHLDTLTSDQMSHLWAALVRDDLATGPDPSLSVISSLSHTDVVLALASDPTEMGMDIMEILIQKSIYLCARGETGQPLTDIRDRPLRTPMGHRRGETSTKIWPSREMMTRLRTRNSRRDNRVVVHIAPNPKDPGRLAWHRYEQYRLGASVEELIDTTRLSRADIRWDLRQGHVVAVPPRYAQSCIEQDNEPVVQSEGETRCASSRV